jgi:hypothetical protein
MVFSMTILAQQDANRSLHWHPGDWRALVELMEEGDDE